MGCFFPFGGNVINPLVVVYIYTERESYICIELYDVIYVYMYYKYIDIIYIYTNKDSDHGMGDHTPDTIAQE